jgi:hypothetical protein
VLATEPFQMVLPTPDASAAPLFVADLFRSRPHDDAQDARAPLRLAIREPESACEARPGSHPNTAIASLWQASLRRKYSGNGCLNVTHWRGLRSLGNADSIENREHHLFLNLAGRGRL